MSEQTPISTEALIKGMEVLSAELKVATKDSSDKRHQMNGAVSTAVMALRETMELQSTRIQVLEKTAKETTETLFAVRDMSGVVRDISDRLIGNDKYKTTGLVQEVVELRTEYRIKVAVLEAKQEKVDGQIKFLRGVIVAVGVMGAIVTFLQSSGLLHFLAGKVP